MRYKLFHNLSWLPNDCAIDLIREGEREVGGDGVCGCSFGEPLKQETFQTSLYIQTRA
jgi:hypothetical protein